MWDSQVKDGYKRGQAGETLPSVSWDGKKTSAVVEELLRNSSDKAYGATGETRTQSGHVLACENAAFLMPHLCSSPQLGRGRLCC